MTEQRQDDGFKDRQTANPEPPPRPSAESREVSSPLLASVNRIREARSRDDATSSDGGGTGRSDTND
jgi:hypothetical protein